MARLERLRWRLRMLLVALTMAPVRGGSPEGDDDADTDDDAKDAPPPKAEDREDDDEKVNSDDEWKVKARKHENALKRERKLREAAEQKVKDREKADMSEQEQALEKARDEARAEAKAEADKERRHDKLEVHSTRLAAKGFEIGEGDDAQAVKFADPDDALVYIERAIRAGDVDEDDIFDSEGKVQTDALKTALGEILESKPHLRATENGSKPKGSADTRKGSPAQKNLESMTPEDHARAKYGSTK